MAAAFINQVPASSYGFDFRYTHGWAFLYRTTAPPRLWQGWGGRKSNLVRWRVLFSTSVCLLSALMSIHYALTSLLDFCVPSLLFNVHSTVNQKTPGSSEAGSCVVYFQTVRKRRHLILRGSRQRRQASQNLSTAAFSSERERV